LTVTWIKARLQPTEDSDKVAQAIRNIFGEIELETKKDVVSSRLEGLEALGRLKSGIARVQDSTT